GDTGVQTHTRTLQEGLRAAGVACEVVTPLASPRFWLPIFAVRKLIGPFNRTWSTQWYRRWHGVALRQALRARLLAALGRGDPPPAVLAQCPVSAGVALDLRRELGLRFRVVMACHVKFSEALEYRDKGE